EVPGGDGFQLGIRRRRALPGQLPIGPYAVQSWPGQQGHFKNGLVAGGTVAYLTRENHVNTRTIESEVQYLYNRSMDEGQIAPNAMDAPLVPRLGTIDVEQMKIYARELSTLYHQELETRRQLETKNEELELRVRELSALNTMCRQHLELCMLSKDSLCKLAVSMSKLSDEANQFLREIEKLKTQVAGHLNSQPPL
ncbi:MAG: hypothetical protein Q7T05_03855, partial [Dehalococcoidia bacterium]|nr:hypothetical protein [Dehalococcoidia bacterium]